MARASKRKKGFRWPTFLSFAGSKHFAIASTVLSALALIAALERYVWIGALVSELRFHLALAAAAIAAVALFKRAWLAAAALSALSALYAAPLAPLYRTTRPTPSSGPLLRVSTAHLAGVPLAESELAAFLSRAQPDALALTGIGTTDIGGRIGPYRVLRGNAELRTLLLVQNALIVPGRERSGAHPTQNVRAGRCNARLVAVELPPLTVYTTLDTRTRHIAELAALPSAPRSIWFGHFGSRADAQDLTEFRARHTLRDGRLGHGRAATAPSALKALGFPLSHVLVHGWMRVRELTVGEPLIGSAHRTLTAVVELTEPRCRFSKSKTE